MEFVVAKEKDLERMCQITKMAKNQLKKMGLEMCIRDSRTGEDGRRDCRGAGRSKGKNQDFCGSGYTGVSGYGRKNQ